MDNIKKPIMYLEIGMEVPGLIGGILKITRLDRFKNTGEFEYIAHKEHLGEAESKRVNRLARKEIEEHEKRKKEANDRG